MSNVFLPGQYPSYWDLHLSVSSLLFGSTLSLKTLFWQPVTSLRACTSNRVGVQLPHPQPCSTRTTCLVHIFTMTILILYCLSLFLNDSQISANIYNNLLIKTEHVTRKSFSAVLQLHTSSNYTLVCYIDAYLLTYFYCQVILYNLSPKH